MRKIKMFLLNIHLYQASGTYGSLYIGYMAPSVGKKQQQKLLCQFN